MGVIYKISLPFSMSDSDCIEVFGERDMGSYDWRIIVGGLVAHGSNNAGYGCAEVALRDALIFATGEGV